MVQQRIVVDQALYVIKVVDINNNSLMRFKYCQSADYFIESRRVNMFTYKKKNEF